MPPHRPAPHPSRRRRLHRPGTARRHPPHHRRPQGPRPGHGRCPGRTRHRHPRRDHRGRHPAHHHRPHPLPGRLRTRPAPRLRHRPRRMGPRAHQQHPGPGTGGPARRKPAPGSTPEPSRPPSPAATAATADDTAFKVWLRRLYTHPRTGELIAMDSRARIFPPGLRRLIQTRDDTCRTPYCDAPIRHLDHITPWHHGGKTTQTNGAGLCEACNHTKETPGWTARPITEPGPGRRAGPGTRHQAPPRPLHRAQTTAHPRTHHPHRPHLPLHSPTPAGNPASPTRHGTASIPPTAPTPAPRQNAQTRPQHPSAA